MPLRAKAKRELINGTAQFKYEETELNEFTLDNPFRCYMSIRNETPELTEQASANVNGTYVTFELQTNRNSEKVLTASEIATIPTLYKWKDGEVSGLPNWPNREKGESRLAFLKRQEEAITEYQGAEVPHVTLTNCISVPLDKLKEEIKRSDAQLKLERDWAKWLAMFTEDPSKNKKLKSDINRALRAIRLKQKELGKKKARGKPNPIIRAWWDRVILLGNSKGVSYVKNLLERKRDDIDNLIKPYDAFISKIKENREPLEPELAGALEKVTLSCDVYVDLESIRGDPIRVYLSGSPDVGSE